MQSITAIERTLSESIPLLKMDLETAQKVMKGTAPFHGKFVIDDQQAESVWLALKCWDETDIKSKSKSPEVQELAFTAKSLIKQFQEATDELVERGLLSPC